MGETPKLVTDLNERERKRYATDCEQLSNVFKDLAGYIKSGDDLGAAILMVVLSTAGATTVNELLDVFKAAVPVNIPDHPPTDPSCQ